MRASGSGFEGWLGPNEIAATELPVFGGVPGRRSNLSEEGLFGPAAVVQLQGGDVGVILAGDEGGVALARLMIEDQELGHRRRRSLRRDQPSAVRPG